MNEGEREARRKTKGGSKRVSERGCEGVERLFE